MTITLFTRSVCLWAYGSEAIIKALDLDVDVQLVEKDATLFNKVTPENAHFTPALYDSETGVTITQSLAVNAYLIALAEKQGKSIHGLLGSKPEHKYEALQWECFIGGDIGSVLFRGLIKPKYAGTGVPTKEQRKEAEDSAERAVSILEDHLTKHTYLVGEQITVPDIYGAALIGTIINSVLTPDWRKAHPAIIRWVSTIAKGKYFHGRFGKTAVKFELPPYDPIARFYAPPKAPAKEVKKEAPKAEPKPVPPKKPQHPLAALGPSSIPLDDFVRLYANNDTRKEALPYFWNEFYNNDEWSLWKVDYKYNDELKLTFMSNNLVSGFFARLSASDKYIFGAMVVYGENNNNGIQGAFVIRGKEFMPAFDVAPDWESFEFTRLDASNPKDREFVGDLWAWDKPLLIDGKEREIVDGEVFK